MNTLHTTRHLKIMDLSILKLLSIILVLFINKKLLNKIKLSRKLEHEIIQVLRDTTKISFVTAKKIFLIYILMFT